MENMSLSARRAWIEMDDVRDKKGNDDVALRKESVDRNPSIMLYNCIVIRRSPQGERG